MRFTKTVRLVCGVLLLFTVSLGLAQSPRFPDADNDPVLAQIIQRGQNDNQVMTWLDYLTNRFGGRYIGSDAYENAANWAVHQFHSWGVQAELQEAGEIAVGFNRGPWFGKMTAPTEKVLVFWDALLHCGHKGRAAGRRGHRP